MISGEGNYRLLMSVGGMGAVLLLLVAWGLRQTARPSEAQRVVVTGRDSPFSGDRAYQDLEEIVAIGPRVAGTEAAERTRTWIQRKFQQVKVPLEEQRFEADTPLGKRSMVNVIGKVKGSKPGIILLSNHYDTKYFPDFKFIGANDGGSTTAWMTEMARALGPTREGYSVWLVFFDGEEAFKEWSATDSLYGSRALAEMLEKENALGEIKALINVDMIGDCYLGIFDDADAPAWLKQIVWDRADRMGHGKHFLRFSQEVLDDHMPFRKRGVPALNLIDYRYGGSVVDHQTNWHTINDTIEKVCPDSLKMVGDVLYHALIDIDEKAQ